MRMIGTSINLEFSHDLAAQRVARNHALHRLVDDALGMIAIQTRAEGFALDASGPSGMPVEVLLGPFVAGQMHLFRVDHDDEITGVDVRGENRLVLAPKDIGDLDGHASQDQALGIY